MALGGFVPFHFFWGLDRKLEEWSELGKGISLVVLTGSIVLAIYDVLFRR